MPASETRTTAKAPPAAVAGSRERSTATSPPCGEYLTALPIRLTRTRSRRGASRAAGDGGRGGGDPDAVGVRCALLLGGDAGGQRDEVERLALERQRLSQLQAGDVGELVDPAGHARVLVLDAIESGGEPGAVRRRETAGVAAGEHLGLGADHGERVLEVVGDGSQDLIAQADGVPGGVQPADAVEGLGGQAGDGEQAARAAGGRSWPAGRPATRAPATASPNSRGKARKRATRKGGAPRLARPGGSSPRRRRAGRRRPRRRRGRRGPRREAPQGLRPDLRRRRGRRRRFRVGGHGTDRTSAGRGAPSRRAPGAHAICPLHRRPIGPRFAGADDRAARSRFRKKSRWTA